jgi:HEAT repeat protein
VLREGAGSADRRARVAAIHGLEHIGNAEAVDVLIGAIRSKDYVTVGTAARALRKVGDRRAVPALIECLEQRWDTLELPASYACSECKNERPVPRLDSGKHWRRP